MIGSAIPVALAVGGVLLDMRLLARWRRSKAHCGLSLSRRGVIIFGAASAPVYALDRLSSSGSNTPVWMYSDGRMDGVSFGLVGSLEIAWDTRKHDVK